MQRQYYKFIANVQITLIIFIYKSLLFNFFSKSNLQKSFQDFDHLNLNLNRMPGYLTIVLILNILLTLSTDYTYHDDILRFNKKGSEFQSQHF